jgi:ABC-type polysaccharide/polyol phosphate export permease
MCTTSTECETIIIVVLTVMSGMDPHMISWKPVMGLVWLVLSKWVSLGCGSVTVRLRDVIEIVCLRS